MSRWILDRAVDCLGNRGLLLHLLAVGVYNVQVLCCEGGFSCTHLGQMLPRKSEIGSKDTGNS